MNPALAFDVLLAAALLWSAWRTLAAPTPERAVVLFIVFGLLMTLAWARLEAPDIALAEAAIGAGLTGALLLDALGALREEKVGTAYRARPGRVFLSALAGLGLAAVLGQAMLELPPAQPVVPAAVAANLADSGVAHPVTAVLLNFRGYDTLLEIGVLLLALFAMRALGDRNAGAAAPSKPATEAGDPVLQGLARLATPLMLVTAGYLLWAGAYRPGGAFQAGAVLAAALVLLHLAGLLPGWLQPRVWLRLGLAGGFLVFLAVAAALLSQGALLTYPVPLAGALILLIEAALTVSLGLVLAGLFLFLCPPGATRR